MKIEQIYTGCLAQGAYYITSNGEAAIIDPLRDTQEYQERLQRDGVKLKYIIETHFHADFVSGHIDLSVATGAPILFGPGASTAYKSMATVDGQILPLGNVQLKILHTPGHTLESICILLIDENGKEKALFSGDTLFLGDVGRPDLAQKVGEYTQEDLAGMLYDSLMNKVMPLPNDIIIYPAHGAGSACGKNMMKETMDSLGHQKEMNYALNQPSKEAFVSAVLDGLSAPPAYFSAAVQLNKNGYKNLNTVLEEGLEPFTPEEVTQAVEGINALILDTRKNTEFHKGFIPGSINIGIDGGFAPWAGTLIKDVTQALIIVADTGREEEVVTRLSRVGFDNVIGYLDGGIDAWKNAGKEMDTVHRISPEEFAACVDCQTDTVIDIRNNTEYSNVHVENANCKPLADINNWMNDLQDDKHFFIHCAGGYRSMIAASILQARGIRNFTEIEGGMNAIKGTKIPMGI
ncbi:MAG: MBL fold metallo-hydrolase [Brumimicrobium sp.]|nr:MBL fold metallo-hydrolase [Brumimicrobium sp.]MCO5268449.1 MBL fold metallo-hydrolase [Brumimicrobium sp.]